MPRSKVTARSGRIGRLQSVGGLRGKFDRCCHQKGGQRAADSAAAQARNSHGRCSNEAVCGRFGAQTTNVTPRMAFLRRNRKNVAQVPSAISLTGLVWRHRDRWSATKSHVRVVGSSATFGRNPGYILVRVLDIARFAVDAVLRIDDEFWGTRFLNPFIDPGGAITRRRACEYVMFGFFL